LATVPAIVGTARLGNFRLGYESAALAAIRRTFVRILINGVESRTRVRIAGFTIHDALNEEPNTCSLTVDGSAPTVGQSLRVSINSDAPRLLFNGTLQTVDLSYEGQPANWAWACSAIDDLARLNRRIPFGTFSSTSATTIAQSLIASFASGFTATHVEAGLPAISINLDGTEGFSGALQQIVSLIGGYFYVEDLDLHLFLTEMTDTPDPLQTGYAFADNPPVTSSTDLSQLRTRVYGKGHGEATLSDVAALDTVIPIASAVMFSATGGLAISETQRIAYTGTHLGGAGSVVGPSFAPIVAPTLTLSGGSVESGVHQYAYSFVTAAGKTLPSPLGTITTNTTTIPPPGAPTIIDRPPTGGALVVGQTYKWLLTLAPDASHETTAGTVSAGLVGTGHSAGLQAATLAGTGLDNATAVKIYRTVGNGATYYLETSSTVGTFVLNPSSEVIVGTMSDAVLVAQPNPPGANTANYGGATVNGIALGPVSTTSREVYRTAAGAAQLKLLTTIANNTSTGPFVDTFADGTLGANAPATDTSGLTAATGKVNAGSTSILTASSGPFSATGGWALNGTQVIRYTGITGNTLTGVPATGLGSILNTMAYGEHLDPAPALTGVTGLTLALLKDAPVNIWVQRDDVPAQTAQALLDGGDGVYEYYLSDERRGIASLTALCDAHLELFSRPIVTVSYATRDTKTKSGKTIVVNLASPPISQTLTIQEVSITEIDVAPGTPPKFTATASTLRYSLEGMLRRLSGLIQE
jgi:hypothetical protein